MYCFGMASATGYSCFFVAFNVGTSLDIFIYTMDHNGTMLYLTGIAVLLLIFSFAHGPQTGIQETGTKAW